MTQMPGASKKEWRWLSRRLAISDPPSQSYLLAAAFTPPVRRPAQEHNTLPQKMGCTLQGTTSNGRLIGHIVLGAMWIHKRASELSTKLGRPISPRLLMVLEHIILSHHGTPEFGAAVTPKTPEAIIINLIDNLDAKVQMALDAVSDPTTEGDWTDYKKAFGSSLYRPVLR
jgi:hypothetical protein